MTKPIGPYNFKGVGVPEYYLGGDVKIRMVDDVIDYLETNAKTYIKKITDKVESLMDWKLQHYTHPTDGDYHPELDESPFLVGDEVPIYRMMVGSLNWLVTLGRYDVQYSSNTLARYLMLPREGHMKAMRRVFGYLKHYAKFPIVYDTTRPDFTKYQRQRFEWETLYGRVEEEMPYGMPVSKGEGVVLSGFFDASHASCLQTRRSTTGILMFVNNTPIKWYSKRQATIETSTYGSEIVAGRIAVEMAIDLRYRLRMLGVEVIGPTLLFGDNQSMISNVSLPHSVLKKRHAANSYNRCREAVAGDIVRFIYCPTEYNLADMGTKALNGVIHQRLLN